MTEKQSKHDLITSLLVQPIFFVGFCILWPCLWAMVLIGAMVEIDLARVWCIDWVIEIVTMPRRAMELTDEPENTKS